MSIEMMNGMQRGHRLSDIIADVQHHLSRTREAPESPLVQAALEKLYEARSKAKEQSKDQPNEAQE
jgi:hypothetical protein